MLESYSSSEEFGGYKGMLLQIKIDSIQAERDRLLKKHGFKTEKVETKFGVVQRLCFRNPKDEADAENLEALMGEMVKF